MKAKFTPLFLTVAFLILTYPGLADDLYVGPGQTYTTIQDAIDEAVNGDTVIVNDGNYTGEGNRDIDFNGKAIIVRSENGPENCIIDCQASSGNQHRGFTFHNGEGNSSLLDGFTITNGYGPNEDLGNGIRSYGGAILCNGSSPTITRCKIEVNSAKFGGGIYSISASPKIDYCTISGNSVTNTGCGITCDGGSATISRCLITGNVGSFGGGIECVYGGPTIINSIISGNSVTYRGGGIRCIGSSVTIINCTFAENGAGTHGGGLYSQDCTPTITNCILWANTAPDGPQIYGSCLVSYSDVQGGYSGQVNINADPCFVDPVGSDYHLSDSSPCINAGDPCYSPVPGETDIDGDLRIIYGRLDIGADEFLNDPVISVSPLKLKFSALVGGSNPDSQVLSIHNSGTGTLEWQISENCSWLEAVPSSGISTGEPNNVNIQIDISGLDTGRYQSVLTVSDEDAVNNPITVDVVLYVADITPSVFWKNYIDFPDDPFLRSGTPGSNMKWVKLTTLILEDYDPNLVYFQDCQEYVFHYDFATELLDPFVGMSPAEYYQVSLYEQGQQASLGAVITPAEEGILEYGIQFVRYDPYTREEIRDMFNLVKPNIIADQNVTAFYFPTYEQLPTAEENSDWFESQGIPVSSTARWALGNVCYSEGWALGELKLFAGDEIDAAYQNGDLLPGDILLTDNVPAEIPFVAGVISLTPSTPSSHVAILAQTYRVPFVYLALTEDVNKAQQLLGHTILLSVRDDAGVCEVGLKDLDGLLTQEQIDQILALKDPPDLNIQPMALYGAYSADTNDLLPPDIQYFGGKAANYGILRSAIDGNCPVAMALSFDLWNEFLDQNLVPCSDVIIQPGGYLLFWADSDEEQGPTHTNFNLKAGGEYVGLYDIDGTTFVDGKTFGLLGDDVSYGRETDGNDNWVFFSGGTASPNQTNSGGGGGPTEGLFINEFMPDNEITIADANGEYDDWIEIYNAGSTPINLGGMYLTDCPDDPTEWMVPPAITGSTLREEIANRLSGYTYPPADMAALSADLSAIRSLFMNTYITSFTQTQIQAIENILQDPRYGFDENRKIRFRSSTNVEDSEQFTGAGLYSSYSGCLADDLDGDDDGPCICDPNKPNERDVFRAIRKVFASFYNDNAFLERLRHGVDENQVGMAILVHHSFPDEIELANGVAALQKQQSQSVRNIKLVTQYGATSVANPEDGSIPEEVTVVAEPNGITSIELIRQSNLVILGQTVMDWQNDYNDLSELLVAAADEFEQITGKGQYILDFEYKKVAPGGAAIPAGGLVVKQIRQIPSSGDTPTTTTAFLINEPVEYCILPGAIFARHRLKSRWTLETKSMWLTPENLQQSFYADVHLEYAAHGRVRTLEGELPLWPFAAHTFAETTATDDWVMHHLPNPRTYQLKTNDVPTSVSPTESPLVTLADFTGGWNDIELRVDYDQPVPTHGGNTTTDQTFLCPCPDPGGEVFQERTFTGLGGMITTYFYWEQCEGVCKSNEISRFVETVIQGFSTEPIVLHGYYSQSYASSHHNWNDLFLFEPQLEPGISQEILDQLRVQNIRLFLCTCPVPSPCVIVQTYGFDSEPFIPGDFEPDGDVDLADFAAFAVHWPNTVCDDCGGADLTGEGNVDWNDLREFAANWLAGP